MILSFDVTGQTVSSRKNNGKLANKSVNYLSLCFNFKDTEWDNLTKRVLFENGGEKYCKELNEHDQVLVPFEVLVDDYFVFSLYGIDGDVRVTTNQIKIFLGESGFDGDTIAPGEASKSIIDDIYEKLNHTIEMDVIYEDDTTDTFDVVVK